VKPLVLAAATEEAEQQEREGGEKATPSAGSRRMRGELGLRLGGERHVEKLYLVCSWEVER
jgi:hypothetical protein